MVGTIGSLTAWNSDDDVVVDVDIIVGDDACTGGDVDNAMEMISSRVVSGNKKYFQTLLGLLIFSLILSVLAVVTW